MMTPVVVAASTAPAPTGWNDRGNCLVCGERRHYLADVTGFVVVAFTYHSDSKASERTDRVYVTGGPAAYPLAVAERAKLDRAIRGGRVAATAAVLDTVYGRACRPVVH